MEARDTLSSSEELPIQFHRTQLLPYTGLARKSEEGFGPEESAEENSGFAEERSRLGGKRKAYIWVQREGAQLNETNIR